MQCHQKERSNQWIFLIEGKATSTSTQDSIELIAHTHSHTNVRVVRQRPHESFYPGSTSKHKSIKQYDLFKFSS